MKLIRVGLIVLVLMALLGTNVFAAGGQQGSSAAASSSNKEIDVLRIGVSGIPDFGDPQAEMGNTGSRVLYNVYDFLIYRDYKDNSKIKPMLAESWRHIDEKTIEFTLRKDVLFHNGDKLTSADVAYSFERIKKPGFSNMAAWVELLERIDIIDDYTFRFVTIEPDPVFEVRLSNMWGFFVLPKNYIERIGDAEFILKPVGTGPYKMTEISPQRVVLERFDGYYGEKPPVKRAEFYLYAEVGPRITALATGELDIIGEIPIDQIDTVRNMSGLYVEPTLIQNFHMISYNFNHPLMRDIKIRQALDLAIDRQLLVDTLWHGQARVPRGHQFEDFGDLYFPDYPYPEYNPQKARQLLAESSYKGELITYTTNANYYTFGLAAAEAIVDMWKQIGVNAQVLNKPTFAPDDMVGNFSNTLLFEDPAGGLWYRWGNIRHGRSFGNLSSWPLEYVPDEYLRAGIELVSTMDKNRRVVAARRLMEIADYEVPFSILYQPIDAFGVSNKINWKPTTFHSINLRAGNISLR